MAKPGDTGFTSSRGPTKVESNTQVDYEVNEKGEARNRTDLAALSIGVRCFSVVCGGKACASLWLRLLGHQARATPAPIQSLLPGYSAPGNSYLQPI